ncbi:GAF and ANTAR domain-containing protein [Pseudarthrobacter sp. R1]|uniref:GAF and ANTAR domain-containing protein n=1 Tax=Pseudarthrobacter sp. R1 TaxID=2944934 RepID=UPI002109286F|nr:GAF and ANTAR domain-containing protein [Pseudarthrobacter sp. R1]MCQ6271084.1 GAF and ANTAR domain-containing protein [Pseudarthrobacter sp. R1]
MVQDRSTQQDNGVADYLQDLVLASSDVEELLTELATFSAASLSTHNKLLCGVTLMRRKKPTTVATSDPAVLPLDELQYGHGDGPCLAALREKATVHVPDLRDETRWPRYCKAAWAEGIGSILSVPLPLEGEAHAGLNLYSTSTHAFSGEDIDKAEAYATQASKALRMAVKVAQLVDDRNNLAAAMESRTTIDIAVGAIMAQNRCSQETAMKILRIASSSRNIKLRDVAASIVASVSQDPKVLTHFEP